MMSGWTARAAIKEEGDATILVTSYPERRLGPPPPPSVSRRLRDDNPRSAAQHDVWFRRVRHHRARFAVAFFTVRIIFWIPASVDFWQKAILPFLAAEAIDRREVGARGVRAPRAQRQRGMGSQRLRGGGIRLVLCPVASPSWVWREHGTARVEMNETVGGRARGIDSSGGRATASALFAVYCLAHRRHVVVGKRRRVAAPAPSSCRASAPSRPQVPLGCIYFWAVSHLGITALQWFWGSKIVRAALAMAQGDDSQREIEAKNA